MLLIAIVFSFAFDCVSFSLYVFGNLHSISDVFKTLKLKEAELTELNEKLKKMEEEMKQEIEKLEKEREKLKSQIRDMYCQVQKAEGVLQENVINKYSEFVSD